MMGERGLGVRTDSKTQTWEESDFPIACKSCLGQNKLIRMMKTSFDRACRVCERPFTVFRWRGSNKERFKKTEICQVCSKNKNVCQSCIQDLETGQSLYERDEHIDLDNKFGVPKDYVNKDYWIQLQAIKAQENNKFMKTQQPDTDATEQNSINEKKPVSSPENTDRKDVNNKEDKTFDHHIPSKDQDISNKGEDRADEAQENVQDEEANREDK